MKENQRIAITRRLLKEGLLRLLEQYPLDKISVSALCQESGINRATFYRHYTTPQDVLLEIEGEIMQRAFPRSFRPVALEELLSHMTEICTAIHQHSRIMKILFSCNTDELMMLRFNQIYDYFLSLRRQERQLSHIDEDRARLLAAMLGGGAYFLLRRWILEDIPKSPEEIAGMLCELCHLPALKPPDRS